MKLNELGFDFSNASNFVIKRKRWFAGLIVGIFGMVFLFLFLTFFIMYLFRIPTTINGVIYNFGTPTYQKTYNLLLILFGSLTLLGIIATVLASSGKAKPYIIKSQNDNFEDLYYIYNRGLEIYLTKTKMIIFRKKYGRVDVETSKEAIDQSYKYYIFWDEFSDLKDYQIKKTNKKTILRFKEQIGRIVYHKSYKFENLGSVLPSKIVETSRYSTLGNNRIQKANIYYIEDVNRTTTLNIPREILDKIHLTK